MTQAVLDASRQRVLNSLNGHIGELHVERVAGTQTQLRTQTQVLGEAEAPEVTANDPGLGALVAVIAVLGTVLMLAGLPAAAALSVLVGVSAPVSYALELAASVLICAVALAAAWVVTRRRLMRPPANGIAIDFD
jgi:hypothetical protein